MAEVDQVCQGVEDMNISKYGTYRLVEASISGSVRVEPQRKGYFRQVTDKYIRECKS